MRSHLLLSLLLSCAISSTVATLPITSRTSSSEACHAIGVRCKGAPGRPYVPYLRGCCATGSDCTDPDPDYGFRCSDPQRTAAPATTSAAASSTAAPQPIGAYMIIIGRNYTRGALGPYIAALPPIYAKYGGRYVGFSVPPETLEGNPAQATIVSGWPSVEAANQFWNSPEYTEAKKLREGVGKFDIQLVPALPSTGEAA